jgi:hypothetical protein
MMQGSSQPISKTIGLVLFPLRNPNEECGQMLEYLLSKNLAGIKLSKLGLKLLRK